MRDIDTKPHRMAFGRTKLWPYLKPEHFSHGNPTVSARNRCAQL